MKRAPVLCLWLCVVPYSMSDNTATLCNVVIYLVVSFSTIPGIGVYVNKKDR